MNDLHGRAHALLAASGGRPLCTSCIASALGVGLGDARRAVNTLREDHLVDDERRCRGCGTFKGFHDVVAWRTIARQAA